ncbi:MAG: ATP synthase subunit I [Nitrosomonas sp.]|nr:ATP synthase subunit I [Nitrosomonas sp.]MDP1949793.1 ATP synthase subunit I [Nitrosomonas sp.]
MEGELPWIKNRPLRIIIRWQMLFTLSMVLGCCLLAGFHGAISALLGGLVNVMSSAAFAVVVSKHKGFTASCVLRTALRAEAIKIIIIVLFLWLILAKYKEVDMLIFIGTFTVAVMINGMALLISEDAKTI